MRVNDGPQLDGVADGVLAPVPMLPAVATVYLALLIGIVPTAAVCGVFMGLARSLRGFTGAVVVGGVGFLAPLVPLFVLSLLGPDPDLRVFFLVVRILSVAFGFMLYKIAAPVVRGHSVLDGKEIPLILVIVPAFGLLFAAPGTVLLTLQAPVLALIAWLA